MEGWIKLHRKILGWKYFKNSEIYHLFTTIVLLANHKDGFTKDGTKVNKGQLMTSRQSLSEQTGLSESKVYRILTKLEIEQQIKQAPSRKNTIITIVNYDEYQGSEQDSEQLVNSQRTTGEQLVNTNKNANNANNEKNIIIKASPLSFLFDSRPDIKEWLDKGNHDTHLVILKTEKSHHELAELIEKAFNWALPKKQRAETWLLTFINNKNTSSYGANKGQKQKTLVTPDNPTGDPYLAQLNELRAKGEIA